MRALILSAWLVVAAPAAFALPPLPPGLNAGMKLAVVGAGQGADLAVLSRAVGPQGRVYVLPLAEPGAPPTPPAAEPNVRVSPGGSPFGLGLPEPLDYVWLTTRGQGGSYMSAIASGLKPGGRLLIAPAPDDPLRVTAEAEAAGLEVDPAAPPGALRFRKP